MFRNISISVEQLVIV